MKRLALAVLLAGLAFRPASADPYLLMMGLPYMVQAGQMVAQYSLPVFCAIGYGASHLPTVHVFGTDRVTVGLDLGSYDSRSKNVYGLQLSFCGGGFSEDLYGLQFGLLTTGWVDGFDNAKSRMNGLQLAPFGANAGIVNGFQVCPFLAWNRQTNGFQLSCCYGASEIVNGFQFGGVLSRAKRVNGFQFGIVNLTDRLNGLQLGLYNSTVRGHCLQLGVANVISGSRRHPFLPLANGSFR